MKNITIINDIIIDSFTVIINPNIMNLKKYFISHDLVIKKKYDALRSYYVDGMTVEKITEKYDYTVSSFYSLIRDFKIHLKKHPEKDYFFLEKKTGRHKSDYTNKLDKLIISLRKRNFSIPDIKIILDAQEEMVSESYCYRVLKNDGFKRLPRRKKSEINNPATTKITAPKSKQLDFSSETFSSSSVGILCLLPYLKKLGIDQLIKNSLYPETNKINRLSSILSFVALKLSNIRRYSCDDLWCMDRGSGLFAGLNVLPKTAWLSSYSSRVTRGMNLDFLRTLHNIWNEEGLLGDTVNLDFTTIPYWGEDKHLENNWSGKRRHALSSILAVLAQNPDTGIIDYGNTNVLHKNESSIILEFLDFYYSGSEKSELKYLVFDSKFTNYQNLGILNRKGIKFVTIRRRGKNIVDRLNNIPTSQKKRIRVECAGNKKRTLYTFEEQVLLKGYNEDNTPKADLERVRQVAISGHGKVKPALIITNDFDLPLPDLVRKYARRWVVEKGISEQIDFFHLNRDSSSMVIKVDFDLTISILTHNLYRLFALDLERYENLCNYSIYEKFIRNSGYVKVTADKIEIYLKKKRNLPAILTVMKKYEDYNYSFLDSKSISFKDASNS